jgi:hypothetical protein
MSEWINNFRIHSQPEQDTRPGQQNADKKREDEDNHIMNVCIVFGRQKARTVRWAGHIARKGETRNGGIVLVGNFKGEKPLTRRWKDNIKLDF